MFAALAIAWTWPLAAHLRDALPGRPGDNYSFVWNLWWMRHVLATPGLGYFHTTYLFFPFGTTIVDHPHTALPALVAATLLKTASPVTAQNLLLLAYVWANMASAYALAWDITSHRRAAILAGVIFGLSPYLAAHLLGHFDLVAAWLLPLFALLVRRATLSGATRWAVAAGLILVATAYTAYYYVVYLAFLLAVYLIAWLEWTAVGWQSRTRTPTILWIRRAVAATMILLTAIAVWIVVTGGGSAVLGTTISARTPQNVLTGIWIGAALYAACLWRPVLTWVEMPRARARRAAAVGAWIAVVFVVGAAPLLWQAALLVAHREYVTPAYQWRSAPHGVDLIAPLLGPPHHPWLQTATIASAWTHRDPIEAVGWLGLVPVLLLWRSFARSEQPADVRLWRIVAAAFVLWALGPTLTIAGFDTGLKLPEILLRYVPFVANARIPGRAMIGVFLALALLAGTELAAAPAWRRSALVQWLLIAVIAFEYWDSPIPLTRLDRPDVYQTLRAEPPGAVCEVPLGIGDGLSVGTGSQERRVLYDATLHEHPVVGGYIGRMPAQAARRYEDMPIVGTLLRLSDGRSGTDPGLADASPCHYLVVNREAASSALRAFVQQLPLDHISSDGRRDLYLVKSSAIR